MARGMRLRWACSSQGTVVEAYPFCYGSLRRAPQCGDEEQGKRMRHRMEGWLSPSSAGLRLGGYADAAEEACGYADD